LFPIALCRPVAVARAHALKELKPNATATPEAVNSTTLVDKLLPLGRQLEFDGSSTPVKTALFLLVCLAWLLPGLVGHDPWKSEEAVTFGLAHHILQTGDWVIPTVAGEPHVETAPLYAMLAALSAKLFAPLFPAHDGARLATGLLVATTIWFLALTANTLFGPRFGRLSALLLIGSLGLLLRAHEMSPEIAVFAALSFGIYALTQLRAGARLGGILLGSALGATFLAGGLAPALMLLAAALVLCWTTPAWRPDNVWASVLVGSIAAAPWFAAWPLALWQASPELAREFWSEQFRMLAGVFGKGSDPLYFVRILAWFAWPSLPIILARLWYERLNMLRASELRLPLIVFAVFMAGLTLSNETRDSTALPLLLPLALIAAASVDAMRRAAASALDWFGMMTFGLFTALIWLAWLAAFTGFPARLARELNNLAPGVGVEFGIGKFLFGALLTILWIAIIAHTRRSNRRAIVNWTAGITIFWILLMTLWLPVIDEARSYRKTMLGLRGVLPSANSCVSGQGFNLSQKALFDYLIGLRIKPVTSLDEADCKYLLVLGQRKRTPDVAPAWEQVWQGARPNDKRQLMRLYRHRASS
jgi:4-amino-4-deoxy-L-arabinose transferase-like glycosyltransferase